MLGLRLFHRDLFVDILSSFIKSARFTRHEYEEYVQPVIEQEVEAAASDPATRALEIAHALAFRSGLGSSLFGPAHSSVTVEDVKSFAESTFTKDNVVVLGTGIEQAMLARLSEKYLNLKTAAAISSPASRYHGGENRAEDFTGTQTLFVGYGTTGAPSAGNAALAAHLSPIPSIKWSNGISVIGASIPQDSSVKAVYLPYSDATLFGFLIQGATTASVKEAGKVSVQALKSAASGIKEEDLKRAVAKAKFSAAQAVDTKHGFITALGNKVLLCPLPHLRTVNSPIPDSRWIGNITGGHIGITK